MENNEDFSKYCNRPYCFNGEQEGTDDCSTLVKRFYEDHGWHDINYVKPTDQDWYIKDPLYMQRYLVKHFDMTRDINQIEFGDIIYFSINSEGHVGVALPYGRILMTYPKINEFNGGVSFIDRYKYWFNMRGVEFKAVFKRRKPKEGDDNK